MKRSITIQYTTTEANQIVVSLKVDDRLMKVDVCEDEIFCGRACPIDIDLTPILDHLTKLNLKSTFHVEYLPEED